MPKFTLYFVTVCVFLLGSLTATIAQENVTTVTLPAINLGIGETTTLDAEIACAVEGGCSAFDIKLAFDPAVIRVNKVEIGPYLGAQAFEVKNEIDNVAGAVWLVAAVLGDMPQPTSNILFSLDVTALAGGSSRLIVTQIDIADAAGYPVAAAGIDGVVIVGEAAATPVPTVVPVPTLNPTDVPTAIQADKWCSGVDIVFFAGGSPSDAFSPVVYNGAAQAADVLGPNLQVVWSDWDPQKMVRQFAEAVATRPDGIAVMGHPGVGAFQTAIDNALAQGIIVTSQNTTLDRLESEYSAQGFGYAGAELYSAGYRLGAEAKKRSGVEEGDRAMVWGMLSQPTRGLRTQGVIDALEEAGLMVDYLEIDSATNADASAGTSTFVAYVNANPDVKLVVVDHGWLTASFNLFLSAAGLGPDAIYVAGFDLVSVTVEAIRAGWLDLVIDQQQWLQGYFPVLQICLTAKYGFSGLHIDTGSGFADAENIELLAPLVERQIR